MCDLIFGTYFSYLFQCGSQEHENAVAEHKAAEARLDAEREDLLAQLEHLKGQVHEKERQIQEADEQVEKPDPFPSFGNTSVWNGLVTPCVQSTS